MASVSFNQWISMQCDNPKFAPVAKAWVSKRGRLTRATVVGRAGELAGEAYDAYCDAVGLPREAPPAPAAPVAA